MVFHNASGREETRSRCSGSQLPPSGQAEPASSNERPDLQPYSAMIVDLQLRWAPRTNSADRARGVIRFPSNTSFVKRALYLLLRGALFPAGGGVSESAVSAAMPELAHRHAHEPTRRR